MEEYLIIPALIAVWFGLGYFFARFSGWGTLAAKFPERAESSRKTYRFRTLRIGWSRYSGCVIFSVAPNSLQLSMIFLFLIGHKPIHIPWREIKVVKKGILTTRMIVNKVELTVPTSVIDGAEELGYIKS